MEKPRIYADYNKMAGGPNGEYWLLLQCIGISIDLERLGLTFSDGLEAIFYMDDGDENGNPDDLEGDGIVRFDHAHYGWVAEMDESTIRHASDRIRQQKPKP